MAENANTFPSISPVSFPQARTAALRVLTAPALDSLELPCNDQHGDFGIHAVVDGVLVSFCPFYFEGCELRQRSAALVATDGFDALFEAAVPGVAEIDRMGCDPARYARVAAAYAAIRIDCVAHGE